MNEKTIIREYPIRPIAAVGAAVRRDGQVLIVRRGKSPGYGVWSMPGGAVELGEQMGEAAAREVREECGIEVAVGEPVGVHDAVTRDEHGRILYHYAIVDFVADYLRGTLTPNEELLAAAWVTPEQFDAYDLPFPVRAMLLKALQLP